MKYLVLKGIGIGSQYYPGALSTSVGGGANSSTQALASLNGIVNGSTLYFPASGVSAEVLSINRSAKAVTLSQSVSTHPKDTVYINPAILELDESSYGDTLQGHVAEGFYLAVSAGPSLASSPSPASSSAPAGASGTSGTSSSATPPPSNASSSSTTSSAPAGFTTVTVQVPPNDEVKVEPIGS